MYNLKARETEILHEYTVYVVGIQAKYVNFNGGCERRTNDGAAGWRFRRCGAQRMRGQQEQDRSAQGHIALRRSTQPRIHKPSLVYTPHDAVAPNNLRMTRET